MTTAQRRTIPGESPTGDPLPRRIRVPRYTWNGGDFEHSLCHANQPAVTPDALQVAHECAEELTPFQRVLFALVLQDFYGLPAALRRVVSGRVEELYSQTQISRREQERQLRALLAALPQVPAPRGAKHAS